MASITVTSSGYWGDDGILASGSWSGLVNGDTVTIQNGAVCTIDPDQQTPTGIDVGVNIACSTGFSSLVINNQSDSALVVNGAYNSDFNIQNSCSLTITGKKVNLLNSGLTDWTSDGSQGQSIPCGAGYGWTGMGFGAIDFCTMVEVEESTGVWEKWLGLHSTHAVGLSLCGVGELGRFFVYNASTGAIEFGDGGKPQALAYSAASGQAYIDVSDASDFIAGDIIHIVDDTGAEYLQRVEIDTISAGGGEGGSDRVNLVENTERAFTTANNALIRLTYGGHIPPSGAKVRVYNTGIATANGSGRTNPASFSDATNIQIGNNASFSCENFYALAGALYTYSSVASIKEFSTCYQFRTDSTQLVFEDGAFTINPFEATPTYIYRQVGVYNVDYKRLKFCSDNVSGQSMFSQSMPDSCTFTDCYFERFNNTAAYNAGVIYSSSTGKHTFNGCTFVGGKILMPYPKEIKEINDCRISYSTTGIMQDGGSDSYKYLVQGCKVNGLTSIPEGCDNDKQVRFYDCSEVINVNIRTLPTLTYQFIRPSLNQGTAIKRAVFTKHAGSGGTVFYTDQALYVDIVDLYYSETLVPVLTYTVANYLIAHVDSDLTPLTSQSVVRGCHFYELRYDKTNGYGIIGVHCGANMAGRFSNFVTESPAGATVFTGSRLYLKTDSSSVTYVWPHRILGVTAFRNVAPTIAGSGTGNFTVEFKINGGSWQALNQTNIYAANFTGMENGFSFSIRISRTTGSVSEYLSYLYIDCEVGYENHQYPIENVNITLQNIKDGSRYYVYNQTTSEEVATGVQSGTADIIIPDVPYNGVSETLLIRVRKGGGGATDYKPFETNATLTANGATVWISQVLDDLTT